MNVKSFVAVLIANALLSTALLIGYALLMASPQAPRFAVLDVGELYRLKESQVTAVLMKRDATEEERSSALKTAGSFGNEVTSLLQTLQDECRCLVLARGAVIGQPQALPDLTPDVRKRLGL
jgi:hypothetical protein